MTRTHKKVRYSPKSEVYRRPNAPAEAAHDTEQALRMLEGRWKLVIIFQLFVHPILRFSALEPAIPTVSQKMLIQQLRELERDGIVRGTVYPEVLPTVDYALTAFEQALRLAADALLKWAA